MDSASKATSTISGDVAEDVDQCLQLQLHTDEAVWMRQIGHLKDWCAQTRTIKLGVPARVTTAVAADSLRLLWLFQHLQHVDITLNSTRSRIEQPVLTACAELLHLTTLNVSGGHLDRRGLDLGVLTSLRHLHTLSVRPHSDEGLDGLEDDHIASAARLTSLRSLSLRASENVTDEGVGALSALTGLTQLSLVPIGLWVSRDGVTALSAALPNLAALSVGLHESRQVAALKGLADRDRRTAPAISLVLNSPEVSTSGFFSTLTLVLRPNLVSLRLATVESTDASFLLAVGTLVQLTELKMGVSLPEGGRPFTCNLAALSPLAKLHTLEFAVTQDLQLPLSVKLVSMLALSWPNLRSLSLSVMAKPEVVPEALGLLDNFRTLTSLSLFAPLDYSCDENVNAITLPVNPRYLPHGLVQLVLECAELSDRPSQRRSATGDYTPQGAVVTAEAVEGLASQINDGVLPYLQHLELNSCTVSNNQLTTILSCATGLRHLELSDTCGVTDAALGTLRCLTRLEYLAVRLSGLAAGFDEGVVSHKSLTALCNASTLRHLEWSLPEPLSAVALEELCSGALSSLGGLQELALHVAPELRNEAAGVSGPARSSESGNGVGEKRGLRWQEKIQQLLPLCTVSERPSIVLYDLWHDQTVQVIGP